MSLLRLSLLALTAAAAAGAARAAPEASPVPAPTAAPSSSWSAAAKPVKDTDLDTLSGGQSIAALNEQQLKAMNSGEVSAQTVTNGAASVNLSGFSGLGNFVVNTGNNNNLQGTMSVNIMLTPSP